MKEKFEKEIKEIIKRYQPTLKDFADLTKQIEPFLEELKKVELLIREILDVMLKFSRKI